MFYYYRAMSLEVYIKFKEEKVMEFLLAKKQDAEQVYDLVQETIRAGRFFVSDLLSWMIPSGDAATESE